MSKSVKHAEVDTSGKIHIEYDPEPIVEGEISDTTVAKIRDGMVTNAKVPDGLVGPMHERAKVSGMDEPVEVHPDGTVTGFKIPDSIVGPMHERAKMSGMDEPVEVNPDGTVTVLNRRHEISAYLGEELSDLQIKKDKLFDEAFKLLRWKDDLITTLQSQLAERNALIERLNFKPVNKKPREGEKSNV